MQKYLITTVPATAAPAFTDLQLAEDAHTEAAQVYHAVPSHYNSSRLGYAYRTFVTLRDQLNPLYDCTAQRPVINASAAPFSFGGATL